MCRGTVGRQRSFRHRPTFSSFLGDPCFPYDASSPTAILPLLLLPVCRSLGIYCLHTTAAPKSPACCKKLVFSTQSFPSFFVFQQPTC
ncbi:hypothetical protein N656DRAFT_337321 [Canariomyces notabilis]|uniref:Uncharacterized protein n=1 Tax=Canariomyces notabilis TaxID=2074819 RepID=A0AAN6QJW9_9PEZI|nr:hypothetical protein N656DRAFT_337321 [Canariomyces arenarius]